MLGWTILGSSLVAAVTLAVAGTSSLRHAAVEQRETALAAQIDTGINKLHALEWQARSEQGVSTELGRGVLQTDRQVEQSFRDLVRLEGGVTYRNLRAYRTYARFTNRELNLLRAGKLVAAARLDEREVDPRAAALTGLIGEQTREIEAAARSIDGEARGLLLGALVATAVLVALLFWQFALQQMGRRRDRGLLTRLNELSRQKDEFVATVSHELRTPLTSICGYAELLEGEAELSAEQHRWVHVIGRNADRLHTLVTDLLLIAEVGAGKFTLDVGSVDITDVVADAVEAARPAADEKGLELTNRPEGLIELQGDGARLGQVIDNLLSNAIKFTPSGGSVAVRTGVHGGRAFIEVADSGIGIEPADVQRLFERFFRADHTTPDAIPGTGLGLAISKTIVDAHRGTIAAASVLGVGTTFRIELPTEEASPSNAALGGRELPTLSSEAGRPAHAVAGTGSAL